MRIQTLQQWNESLGMCGCCPMPVCPAPELICSAKYAAISRSDTWDGITYDASGDLFAGDPFEFRAFHPAWTDDGSLDEVPNIYRKRTVTYEEETRPTNAFDPLPNTAECSATVKTTTTYHYGGGGVPVTISRYTETLSEPLTKAELAAMAVAKMEEDDWSTAGGITCRALTGMIWTGYPPGWEACGFISWAITAFDATATSIALRFRFRIPNAHLGSKFTITYDIAEFPEEGDPSFVSQDNVIEWVGPGTGGEDAPSWLTDWVEIDPPEAPGQRRIVNIRYTCYSGAKYGGKPQVMGEGLEIPPP